MSTYAELASLAQTRKRKLDHNTYLEIHPSDAGDIYAIRLHATDILTFYPDGSVELNSGGWQTVTTKDRMNKFLPAGWYVAQENGVWFVVKRSQDGVHQYDAEYGFANGMRIQPESGEAESAAENPKELFRLRRRVNRFCRSYAQAFVNGKIPPPGPGDCFFCSMRNESSGLPWGDESGDTEHLLSHVEEKYYVPSLLVNAWNAVRTAPAFEWGIAEVWSNGSGEARPLSEKRMPERDYMCREVRAVLASYLYQRFGLPARRTAVR